MAKRYILYDLVRYSLDSLKKEWNDIGKLIRDKKKANKEDPCE